MNTLKKKHICIILILIGVLIFAGIAEARVGGGDSYSGSKSSGGSSSGGGSSDGGLIIYLLMRLFELHFIYPKVAFGIDIVLIGIVVLYYLTRDKQSKQYTTVAKVISTNSTNIHERFESWRKFDPNFSEHLFEDFMHGLYAHVHLARGEKKLDSFAPYLKPDALKSLKQLCPAELTEVSGVIVGSFQCVEVSPPEPTLRVTIRFESNYVEKFKDGKDRTWYAVETWVVSRKRDLLSKPPGKIQTNNCPNCGAGLEFNPDGSCKYCQMTVRAGKFDWGVDSIVLEHREPRGPQLTTNVEDVGLDDPTVYQSNLASARNRFSSLYPDFALPIFVARVKHIFKQLQDAWTTGKWDKARPYETDSIFQMHRYWIDAYRKQNLRNVLDDVKVESVELVRFGSDAFYVSITCRIFASMLDYVVDAEGKVVRGDKKNPMKFSEYWTFIRSRRANKVGEDNGNCPNCGAGLKINMAGECEYCSSKITNGDFDWVLSRIEQDEAYQG